MHNRNRTIVILLLINFILFMPVGCTSNSNKTPEFLKPCQGKKIAILSPTAKVCESLFNTITTLQLTYPNIIHETYPDDFIKQEDAFISKATYLVYHSDVTCLIVVPAIPGTIKLFTNLRRLKPELVLIAVFPMEDPIRLSKVSTAVYYMDFQFINTPLAFENGANAIIKALCLDLNSNSTKNTLNFPINGIYKLEMITNSR